MKRTILLATTILLPSLWLTTPVRAENQATNLTGASGLPAGNLVSLKSERLDKQQNTQSGLRRLRFRIPNIRAAGNREPLASRGSCNASSKPVTALLPSTNIGLTVAAQPTFFFDISQTSARSAEFVVFEDEEEVYSTTVELPNRAGVVGITLPITLKADEATSAQQDVKKLYQWHFSLICDPNDRSKDIALTGSIARIKQSTALTNQLQNAPLRNRPAIYAEAGVWFDTIKTLADLRSANPSDSTLARDWASMLQSVGLQGIAQKPLLGNLAPKNE